MANVIKHKRGSGSDPVANDLVVGEVAIRTDVGKLFTKMDNGSVAEIAGGGSDIAINTLSSSSGTGGGSATFNGSAYRFTLSAPPSVSAQQLLVSINGVIQKPVAGTGQPSEGFSVDGTDIILGDAPATGSDFFILTFKSLGVSEPADNSVTSAKIVDGAIVNADINASAAIAGTKISPDFGSQTITTTGNVNPSYVFISGTAPGIAFDETDSENDFTLGVQGGVFKLRDVDGGVDRYTVNSSGQHQFIGNVDCSAGVDVTGNITVSGTVDGVDLQTLNTAVSANTAKVTNATHTGDVTGSTSLTIANNAVTSAKIADDAVTQAKIADDAVGTDQLANMTLPSGVVVTQQNIAAGQLVTGHIAAGTGFQVGSSNITANAVTESKIANNSVSNGKLTDNAVTSAKLSSNAVSTAKIADQAVTLAKLPHGTSSNDGKFLRANNGADPTFETISTTPADGSITEAKIATGAVTVDKIGNGQVTEAKLNNGSVTVDKIGNGQVTEAKLNNGAVTVDKIGNGQVTTAKIADDAVDGDKVSANMNQSRCKCWCAFNGTGSIQTFDQYGLSGLEDTGTGKYKATFSTAMDTDNFCVVTNQRLDTNGGAPNIVHTGVERDDCTTSTVGIRCGTGNQNAAANSGSFADVSCIYFAVFGDGGKL